MNRCPYCGAEFPDTAEACPQCGTSAAEPDPDDPFAAALAQEQAARRQMEQQRTASVSMYDHPPAAPPPSPADSDAEPESPEPPAKKRFFVRALPVLALAAMLGLTVYTGYSLMLGDVHEDVPDFSYAFYQKDDRLCYYDRSSGRISELTAGGETNVCTQSLYASLVQLSPDGSRVFYPAEMQKDGTCMICYRRRDDMETEYRLAEISLEFCTEPNLAHEYVSGNPDQKRQAQYVNMTPPYLLIGDTLYYRNVWQQLCRKPIGGREEVLAEEVVRWWSIPDCENVYFLKPQDYSMLKMYSSGSGKTQRAADFVGSFEDGASVLEELPNVCCDLWYCEKNGEPCGLAWNVRNWNIPAADSARWFHYLLEPDKYSENDVLLMQMDLLHPQRTEAIWQGDTEAGIAYILRCYPDGSSYIMAAEEEDTGVMRKLWYFSRKQDHLYPVKSEPCEGMVQFDYAVCRDAPYLVQASVRGQGTEDILYYKDEAVPLSLNGWNGLSKTNALRCNFSYYGTRLYIQQLGEESQEYVNESLYTGALAGHSVPAMQPVQDYDAGSIYFSVPSGGETLYFRWSCNSGGRQLVRCGEHSPDAAETLEGVNAAGIQPPCVIYPEYGQMYCMSDYYRKRASLYRFQAAAESKRIADNVLDYQPVDAEKLYLLLCDPADTHGELYYDNGELSVRLDADVTALLKAGIRNTDI